AVGRVDDRLDRLVEEVAAHDPEEEPGPYFFLREDLFLRRGTFAPERRASDRPMAIACLRLFTFFPERPLFSVPRFLSCIARLTFCCAFLPYLAMLPLQGALLGSCRLPSPCRPALVDLRLRAQLAQQRLDPRLRKLLPDPLLDFVQRRDPGRAHVIELDDVVAEPGAHRYFGRLAFVEPDHRLGELPVVVAGRVPVQVAAAVLVARVLAVFRRELLELCPA